MKKSNRCLLLSCFAAALSLASCSDKNEGGGNDTKITPTEGVTTQAFYAGDHYNAGTGSLWINFVSDMQTDPETGDYIGPGYILCLDFSTTLAANPDFAQLVPGTYTAADTHEAFTLNVSEGDSYLTLYNAAGNDTMYEITDGTVTVKIERGYYRIDAALKRDDGTDHPFSFVGKITFLNRSKEGQMSNLTSDIALKEMTQAMVIYAGEAFTTTSDLYMILVAGPDYDLEINYGQSDAMMLSVNVTPGATDGIPSGTYTIIDAMEADDYPVGTALSGVYDNTYASYAGCWYYSTRNKLESSMRGGQIVVTNEGNNAYTFDIRLQDGYGHKVTGTYSGVCRVEDWS